MFAWGWGVSIFGMLGAFTTRPTGRAGGTGTVAVHIIIWDNLFWVLVLRRNYIPHSVLCLSEESDWAIVDGKMPCKYELEYIYMVASYSTYLPTSPDTLFLTLIARV